MELDAARAAVLRAATPDGRTVADLAGEADLPPETVTRAAFELAEDDLVAVREDTETTAELTDEGERYREAGLPEVRLYRAALEAGADEEPVSMGDVLDAASLDGEAVDIALSNFARKGYGGIEEGSVSVDPSADPDADEEAAAMDALAAGENDTVEETTVDQLERRGLVEVTDRTRRTVELTTEGQAALMEGIEVTEAVDRLTPDMLTSGAWQDTDFVAYNVEADAESIQGGRVHVLRQTANRVKDVLVGMGFEEMEGPHVDADFWINDCLFMPQDHPARTHWDRFALADPEEIDDLPGDLVERVRSAHLEGVGDDGEGYHSPWDLDFAKQLALRGHTTSLSARYLAGDAIGDLEPPQRFFSVEKVYRNDTLDPTHLLEFFQIEGWVMADGLSARDLMGTFTEFYERFGITDLQFKPHYNPYTEPSFELFGTHPETGELVEVGNSGIFRPEMLEPLGVDCDVMAWGLSLERLLMLMYGFEDIRDVHGTLCDLELLRETEAVY